MSPVEPQESITDPLTYPHYPISSLVPGPARARFTGTVVNIYSYTINASSPNAAKGCKKILLRDKTAEILVHLWFIETAYENVLLGTMITVAVTHVSSTNRPGMTAEAVKSLAAPLMVTVFPERDAGCTANVLGDMKLGIDQISSQNELGLTTDGLMDLEAFIHGAAAYKSKEETKILVAVVKVGTLTDVTKRDGTTFQILPVEVLDQSCFLASPFGPIAAPTPMCEGGNKSTPPQDGKISGVCERVDVLKMKTCKLSLSLSLKDSVASWRLPCVIMVSNPQLFRTGVRKIKLSYQSQIFCNLSRFSAAVHLRRWVNRCITPSVFPSSIAQNMVEKIHDWKPTENEDGEPGMKRSKLACISMGINTYDRISVSHSSKKKEVRHVSAKVQFTLALFLAQIELEPEFSFRGYISVIITQLNLAHLWRTNMLFCGICLAENCDSQFYSNDATEIYCIDHKSTYGNQNVLNYTSFNPELIGGFADESAGLSMDPCYLNFGTEASSAIASDRPKTPQRQRHNIILTHQAVENLTGLTRADFSPPSCCAPVARANLSSYTDTNERYEALETSSPAVRQMIAPSTCPSNRQLSNSTVGSMDVNLQEIEKKLLWKRATFVMGWSGESEFGPKDGNIILIDIVV